MEICWKCAHHLAIQDVDEFVSSSVDEDTNFTSGSSVVNGCHQNESLSSWQKHNNPQVIHMTPVDQLTSVFIRNKAIIKTFYL